MVLAVIAGPPHGRRAAAQAPPRAAATLLLTADGEGHVGACAGCPGSAGDGGLARRATLVSRLRDQGTVVLLDAGNSLFGGDSADSGGRVIAAAYDALGYAAVNVSYRDFRHGKQATLDALNGSKFVPLSANVTDAVTGKLLFKPYTVVETAGGKLAALGLTDAPPPLPHLQKQLQAVNILSPLEALDEWLPKAKAESDRLVVLYYGSGRGLLKVREKLAGSDALLLAGGIRPDSVPAGGGVPVVAAEEHGKSVARVPLDPRGAQVTQIMVTPDLAADENMTKLVAAYAPKPTATEPPATTDSVSKPADKPAEPPIVAADATKPKDGSAEMPADAKPKEPSGPKGPVANATTDKPPVVADKPPAATEKPVVTAEKPPVTAQTQKELPKRVAARQPLEPKGLAGVGLKQEQVNDAIDRGAEFLWNYIKTEREKANQKFGARAEYDLLNGLALVEAKAHKKFPEFDAQLRAYIPKVRPDEIGVYGCGVFCMLLEAYRDSEFQWQLNRTARYLFEGQSAEASWQYYPKVPEDALKDPRLARALQVWGGRPTDGSPAEQWRRVTDGDKHQGGDNSVTQYALLGLHAASRSGVEVPQDVWKRVLNLYKSRQNPSGSWGYVDAGSADSGSMTCAGIYGVALARYHLGLHPHPEDESIERGLAWLSDHFSVTENPGPGASYHYYYLYALERAGRTLDTEFIGPHEWYPMGAKYLVDAQKPDGSWVEPGSYETQPDLSTSFALLFLTRGTAAPNQPRPTGGNGTIKTATVEPAAPRVYLIFDCSGSMLVETEPGRSKFDAARDGLNDIVKSLPANTQVALRVYGHRKSARDAGADEDTELLVPMGPINPPDIAARVRKLRARGKTPLARSIAEAAKDLAGSTADNPCAVILITDGGEDTRPPGDPVAAAADLARMPGITLHVVGFDIGRDDWGAQLRGIAKAGRGRYWAAADAAALRGELRAAVLRTPETFALKDAQGRTVQQGKFGKSVSVPEGRYTLATSFGGKRFEEPLWVNTGGVTAVMFDAGKIDVTPDAGPPAVPDVRAAKPDPPPAGGGAGDKLAAHPKFCFHCGAPLKPGAKFCTNCGTRVGQ